MERRFTVWFSILLAGIFTPETINAFDETLRPVFLSFEKALPFTFTFGGDPASEVLARCSLEQSSKGLPGKIRTEYRWKDPKTGLNIVAVTDRYPEGGAVDWYLVFENRGEKETPLLENVCVVDIRIPGEDVAKIHTLTGDQCDERSWLTALHPIRRKETKIFRPQGGRSSNGAFPFWNFQSSGDDERFDRLVRLSTSSSRPERGDRLLFPAKRGSVFDVPVPSGTH